MSHERVRGGGSRFGWLVGRGVCALLAAASVLALVGSSCVAIGDPAAWADGEVRELESNRPIRGALVSIESPGRRGGSTGADRSNEAGHFAVFQAVDGLQRTIPLVIVAEGYKPAEYSLPIRQSNPLLVRLAALSSSKASRVVPLPAQPEDGDGADGAE